jgi:hypothetical protein
MNIDKEEFLSIIGKYPKLAWGKLISLADKKSAFAPYDAREEQEVKNLISQCPPESRIIWGPAVVPEGYELKEEGIVNADVYLELWPDEFPIPLILICIPIGDSFPDWLFKFCSRNDASLSFYWNDNSLWVDVYMN